MKSTLKMIARFVLPLLGLVALSSPVLAAGGLQKAQDETSNLVMALYGIVGVGSTGYLLWLAFKAKTGQGTWSDFGMGILYVALAGAVVVIAPAAWNFFVS